MNASPVTVGISAVLLTAVLLYILKPTFMFDEQGDIKGFGVEEQETIFPVSLAIVIAGILGYCYTYLNS